MSRTFRPTAAVLVLATLMLLSGCSSLLVQNEESSPVDSIPTQREIVDPTGFEKIQYHNGIELVPYLESIGVLDLTECSVVDDLEDWSDCKEDQSDEFENKFHQRVRFAVERQKLLQAYARSSSDVPAEKALSYLLARACRTPANRLAFWYVADNSYSDLTRGRFNELVRSWPPTLTQAYALKCVHPE